MEQQDQKEFDQYLGDSKHRDFLNRHPLAFYYLAHRMGTRWLTENDKGKSFIASEAGFKLLPDIAALIKNPTIGGQLGTQIAESLFKLSREGSTKAAEVKTSAESAMAEQFTRMQAYKASLADKQK
jgi:hypothetical protein